MSMEPGPRFEIALVFAARLHREQLRKANLTPYIGHLLGVTALVIDDGGDEEEAIAALLHDAVEDQGGLRRLEEIRAQFGNRVARIVDGCSDTYETPKPPWLERKRAFLSRLSTQPDEIFRVCLADKLYNLRTLLLELRKDPVNTWSKFNGGKEGTLWYYRSLSPIFRQRIPGILQEEYERVLEDINQLVGE